MKSNPRPVDPRWLIRGLVLIVLVLSLIAGYLEADRELLQKQLKSNAAKLQACQAKLTAP